LDLTAKEAAAASKASKKNKSDNSDDSQADDADNTSDAADEPDCVDDGTCPDPAAVVDAAELCEVVTSDLGTVEAGTIDPDTGDCVVNPAPLLPPAPPTTENSQLISNNLLD